VTTHLKKIWKVREFQSSQEKVRKMSEETVLDLPHQTKLVVPIFFCSLRSHIICTPTFELVAPPLVEINCLV